MTRPSLQHRFYALMALFALTALAVSGMLVFLTGTMRAHTDELAAASRDALRVETLRVQLGWYERTRILALARGEPLPAGQEPVRALRRATAALDALSSSTSRARVREIQESVQRYLDLRLQSSGQGRGLPPLEPQIERAFDEAANACDALLRENESLAIRARGVVRAWDQITDIVGFSSAGLLLLLTGLTIWAFHRSVLQPLLRLTDAIGQFGSGALEVRATVDAPREVALVAQTFNEMAERLQHERERRFAFLAGVAHDMANPLMALKMSARVASAGRPLEEREWRGLFERVDRQVLRLQQMLGDLLDASRIEAGKLDLRRADLDARELVLECTELYKPLPASHTLRVELPHVPVSLFADETRLTQVLNNLLSNAIKYSPDGGEVTVRLEVEGEQAVLSVQDEGIGIPTEELPRLFEPFHRSKGVKDAIPGVGLGLSVVRRIVEAHGGELRVQSEVGSGTTFEVRLPLASRAARPPSLDVASASTEL